MNATPLLIESSIDESQYDTKSSKVTPENSKQPENPTVTPLKREGTFTKDGPDFIMSSKSKLSSERSPKRMSLPSGGSTPFHTSKTSLKDKSMLNVTRSIEKSGRRSSLAETVLKTTRVMFCSPVDNPAAASQQKRKVIKSNLKGSNKSFIFDDSGKINNINNLFF
jgi:hypothetical protein